MERKRLERAAVTAAGLAADLSARLPESCAVPAAALVPLLWPLGVRLERMERKAAKGRKQAKAYRRAVRAARREVDGSLDGTDRRQRPCLALGLERVIGFGHGVLLGEAGWIA